MTRKAAVFTIVQDEQRFLPLWINYYRKYFDSQDIFILDHDSKDPTTVAAAESCRRVPVHTDVSFSHSWLCDTVKRFQRFLFASYEIVLFAEDEIVAADPLIYPGGLRSFIDDFDERWAVTNGHEVIHDGNEAPIDWDRQILSQRRWWYPNIRYSKPLLARIDIDWSLGFHTAKNVPPAQPLGSPDSSVTPALYLIHLHRLDYRYCQERHRGAAARKWATRDLQYGLGFQNRLVDDKPLSSWFYEEPREHWREIPQPWKGLL